VRRKLPIFVERSLQQVQADRIELADAFERTIIGHQPVSCKAGCSACCYYPVNITILEAIPIYGALVEHGRWTPSLKDKLRKASEMTSGLSFQVWLLSKIACPLLDANNRCMTYDARPFVCRTTIATGDPYFCDSQRLGNETTVVPRQESVAEFHAREKVILKKHGLLHLTMPIGRAVLMAERVCSGSLMLESVDRTYIADHLADDA
jgi:Fe-S-cluster containining protein